MNTTVISTGTKIPAEKRIPAETKKTVLRKMIRCRSRILKEYPFYGYLVMHLQLGVTACGTACTDMKHLLFDPDFVERLSDDEMIFVMLHEVLHCALSHCIRGLSKVHALYNIAADIVVNSNILYSAGLSEFEVAGIPAMHKTPDGREGYHFSAEEVYQMLLQNEAGSQSGIALEGSSSVGTGNSGKEAEDASVGAGDSGEESEDASVGTFDSHEIWAAVEENGAEADEWRKLIAEGSRKYSSAEVPMSIRDYIVELEREGRVDWRTVLQDFIQLHHDRYDYSFSPSDRRYSWSDFVMPAFSEQEEEQLDNLWFCVDTSGSISTHVLSEVMSEIRQAILLFDHLSGKLSFFDTQVTEPVPFEDEEDLLHIPASGGGGTSFAAIFHFLEEFPEDEMPSAIIVLTDGECPYPKEEAAMDIPVLWVIYNNPVDPPWGRVAHVDPD